MKHELFVTSTAPISENVIPLPRRRLERAKRSFTVRHVDLDLACGLMIEGVPHPGDIVLAQVESIGHHKKLEDSHGRRAAMFVDDNIVVAYGDRYAPDQFEAEVPEDLGPCDLVAGGGVASRVVRKSGMARNPTRIVPVGILTDATGRRLNTADFAIADQSFDDIQDLENGPRVIAVVGSSMNAGKTTAMAALVHGEVRAGKRVAAIKVTGTGSGCDLWAYRDAGAELCLDFTDAGHATTHKLTDEERIDVVHRLLARCRSVAGVDTVLVEVADGLLFSDTERLLLSDAFRGQIDQVVYAAADAMGALSGADWLKREKLPLVALSGAFTASPIAVGEVVLRTKLPVFTWDALVNGALSFGQESVAA